MFEKFLNKLCEIFLAQLKFPRKGVVMIIFLFSTIVIFVNKFVFNYSIAPKESPLLQFIYFMWLVSFVAIPIRMYNEYCDKRELEKSKQDEIKKLEEKNKKYFEMFDYCPEEERDLLAKFYINQTSTCYISDGQANIVSAMRLKGFDFINTNYDPTSFSYKCLISSRGLKLIKQYFDKDKEKYYQFFDSLEAKYIEFVEQFYLKNDNHLVPEKGNKKTAVAVILEFHKHGFEDIYWDSFNKWISISETYLAYITCYFEDKHKITI